jgi:hypothetical protein
MTNMTTIGRMATLVGFFLVGAGCANGAEGGVAEAREQNAASLTPKPNPSTTPAPATTTTTPVALKFSFANEMAKVGGVLEDGALVCKKTSCKSGLVAFGPYTTAVPGGQRVATFQVRGAGVSGLDQVAASFDVFDALSNERLALRTVKGTELPDQTQQKVEVAFNAPEKSKLEFRVGWNGEGELRMYDVEVH